MGWPRHSTRTRGSAALTPRPQSRSTHGRARSRKRGRPLLPNGASCNLTHTLYFERSVRPHSPQLSQTGDKLYAHVMPLGTRSDFEAPKKPPKTQTVRLCGINMCRGSLATVPIYTTKKSAFGATRYETWKRFEKSPTPSPQRKK